MHAVFYETMISTQDLVQIMKHTEKTGFLTDGVNRFCDANVYKLVSRSATSSGLSKNATQTVRQCFRHVLSDKIFTTATNNPKRSDNKANHGVIINNTKPSQQIVQIRGDEKLIDKSQWSKVFHVPISQEEIDKEKKQRKKESSLNKSTKTGNVESNLEIYEDSLVFDYKGSLIELTDEEFENLLSNFDCEYYNLKSIGSMLLHSPLDKERVRDILTNWYFQRDHTNKASVDNYFD